MADLFQSGRIIDLILLLVAVETAALPWLLRRRGTALPLRHFLPTLAAGAALMLAVRMSLTGAAWPWIAAALAAALVAHVLDLWWRLSAD